MKQMTQQMEVHTMVRFAAACSLALTLGFAPTAMAQQTAAGSQPSATAALPKAAPHAAAKPQAAEEKEEAAAPQKPGQEGLKVHGHWKLVAMNPDGTGKKTYEFENSLVSGGSGDRLLVSLLTGQAVAGEWSLRFDNDGAGGLCAVECIILGNPSSTDPLGAICAVNTQLVCFPGLTTTITPSQTTGLSTGLTFSGSFTAASAGTITNVNTFAEFCPAAATVNTLSGTVPYTPALVNFSPTTCAATVGVVAGGPVGAANYFTGTILSSTFSFAAGQLVQVSVTITFS